VRQDLPHTLLRKLFDMERHRTAVQDDALGPQLDSEVAHSPTGPGQHYPFQVGS
jgi:hypothetical protein